MRSSRDLHFDEELVRYVIGDERLKTYIKIILAAIRKSKLQ